MFCAPPCISAPVSILPDAIRPFRMSFPRHRMPVFFPLYGEVGSSLLRFNPATISRPLRTSTSLPFPYVHSPAFNAGFLRRSFRRLMSSGLLGERVDRRTPLFINLTHACGCIVLGKGCPPVRLVYPRPSIFFEFWRKDRHKKTSLKFRDSFGNDGTISVLKRYSQMILL